MARIDILFGPEVESPELELFLTLPTVVDFEEAVREMRDFMAEGIDQQEAVRLAAEAVVPITWSELSADQSLTQQSS